MTDRQLMFTGILIGLAAYAPVNIYLFDGSLLTMLDRAYFLICGAAIASYGFRRPVSTPMEPSGS